MPFLKPIALAPRPSIQATFLWGEVLSKRSESYYPRNRWSWDADGRYHRLCADYAVLVVKEIYTVSTNLSMLVGRVETTLTRTLKYGSRGRNSPRLGGILLFPSFTRGREGHGQII